LGSQLRFNNRGDLAFEGETDTHDEGMYLYSSATQSLVRIAGNGTVIPGVGVIVDLKQFGGLSGITALNDHSQVAFVATVSDGTSARTALLLGSPHGRPQ